MNTEPRVIEIIEPTFTIPPYSYEVLKVTTEVGGKSQTKQSTVGQVEEIDVPSGGCLVEFKSAGGRHMVQPIRLTTKVPAAKKVETKRPEPRRDTTLIGDITVSVKDGESKEIAKALRKKLGETPYLSEELTKGVAEKLKNDKGTEVEIPQPEVKKED